MASPSTVGLQIRHLVMLFFALLCILFTGVPFSIPSFGLPANGAAKRRPKAKEDALSPSSSFSRDSSGLQKRRRRVRRDPLFSPSPAKAARIPPAAVARGRGQNFDKTCCLTDFADKIIHLVIVISLSVFCVVKCFSAVRDLFLTGLELSRIFSWTGIVLSSDWKARISF